MLFKVKGAHAHTHINTQPRALSLTWFTLKAERTRRIRNVHELSLTALRLNKLTVHSAQRKYAPYRCSAVINAFGLLLHC